MAATATPSLLAGSFWRHPVFRTVETGGGLAEFVMRLTNAWAQPSPPWCRYIARTRGLRKQRRYSVRTITCIYPQAGPEGYFGGGSSPWLDGELLSRAAFRFKLRSSCWYLPLPCVPAVSCVFSAHACSTAFCNLIPQSLGFYTPGCVSGPFVNVAVFQ